MTNTKHGSTAKRCSSKRCSAQEGWTSGEGSFVWTQEKIDETIALYEEILADIQNGVMYSKTVDGQDDMMVSYSPADIAMSRDN